jgi:hypothetical protein
MSEWHEDNGGSLEGTY